MAPIGQATSDAARDPGFRLSETGIYEIDRRDGLRRRVYLVCLAIGIPVLAVTWLAARGTDPYIAVVYPPFTAVNVAVAVGLVRRTMRVRTAERLVLVSNVAVYLSGLAVSMLGAADLSQVRDEMTVGALLTINVMVMLAYLAFETREALRVSLAVFGTFVVIVAIRLIPEAMAGRLTGEAVDYLRAMGFLGASVGLLHVLAQTKEQVAKARSAAATMTELAHTDALTGIANRRRLHTVLEAHVEQAEAGQVQLAVILLDIDHFKQINDTHGHDTGDDVLRLIATTLSGSVRDRDVLGRWGGEEFLVIAPHTTADEAAEVAEACRTSLAAVSFPEVGTVTASFGVGSYVRGDSAWGLLRRADEALYRAKAAGRDRVHQHEGRIDSTAGLQADLPA